MAQYIDHTLPTLLRGPLLEEASNEGLDSYQVRRILWSVIAPSTLSDLPEVLSKLARMLCAAESRWPDTLAKLDLVAWPSIISRLKPIAERFSYPKTPSKRRHLGKRGGEGTGHRQRNALYSALLALPDEKSEYANLCDLLMAQVFLAHFRVLSIPTGTELLGGLVKGDTTIEAYEKYSDPKPWPALTINPKHCCLALRGLFSGEKWASEVIAAYPVGLPPEAFATCGGLFFDGSLLEHKKSKEWLVEIQDYLFSYLAQAYGIKARHRGHGRTSGIQAQLGSGTPADVEAFRHDDCQGEDEDGDADDDDDGDDSETATPGGKAGKARRAGSKGKKRAKRRGKQAGSAAGAGSDQAIRASKFFPFALDRLSPSDLALIEIDARCRAEELLATMPLAGRDAGKRDDSDAAENNTKEEVELILFILVMLWTGSDIDRTKGLRICLAKACYEQIPLAFLIPPESEDAGALIRIQVEFPSNAPRREPLPPNDRCRTEFVLLPDAAGLGGLLWRFLKINSPDSLTATNRSGAFDVFLRPDEYYLEHIPLALRRISQDRVVASHLASALFYEILNWTNKDSSAATLITGDLRNMAKVQMFYAVRRMKCLQDIYTGTVRFMRAAIHLARPKVAEGTPEASDFSTLLNCVCQVRVQVPFIRAHRDDEYVGVNVCPTDRAMRKKVKLLIDRVERLWAKRPVKDWSEAHNIYTFYVVWFFGFVTGARPITSPILRTEDFDTLKCARLQDKGAEKARLIWITPDLYKQLTLYEEYVRTTRLATLTERPCWFVNEKDGAPVPVSKETCEPILHGLIRDFPTNIHRRWMFNALLDSGCPYVAEWAGHFRTGNRLVGRCATASPREIGGQILQFIEPIISYLGFRPIQVEF